MKPLAKIPTGFARKLMTVAAFQAMMSCANARMDRPLGAAHGQPAPLALMWTWEDAKNPRFEWSSQLMACPPPCTCQPQSSAISARLDPNCVGPMQQEVQSLEGLERSFLHV
jgi:hypothetical protein